MLPNDIRSLNEAYLKIYDSEENSFEDEMLSEETLLLESVEELEDDEIEEIVEETIYDMLDEGYDFDEIEEVFEDIFSEARVDMSSRAARRKEFMASSEKSAKEAKARGASVVRKEKRAETVAKVKGAVKGALSRVKSAVKSGVEKAKSAVKQTTSVVKKRAAGAAISGYAAGKIAQSAVRSAPGRAREAAASTVGKAREVGSAAKSGVKRGIRNVALSVANRMNEEYDAYDLVLEYLIDMGHAETVSEANYIMSQMDEETIQEIIESQF